VKGQNGGVGRMGLGLGCSGLQQAGEGQVGGGSVEVEGLCRAEAGRHQGVWQPCCTTETSQMYNPWQGGILSVVLCSFPGMLFSPRFTAPLTPLRPAHHCVAPSLLGPRLAYVP
jgi:hypothetical protein